ncbi:MAG: HAD-IA family hydrolase [Deltaproteobacteria bacterium]|nr:HAD-IA family hydrolase [Deltaproteobacteria bacterium]
MREAEKRRIAGCAFDLGNTLINDTRLTTESVTDMSRWLFNQSLISSQDDFIKTYMKVNRETDKPFISHTFGEIEFFEKTLQQLSINKVSANEALRIYREILMEKIHPDQNVLETFEFLKQKGIRIALLSNESVLRVEAYLDKTDLRHYFDTIIVSAGIGIEKPDLRFFQEALNRLTISSEEMVMFGDNAIADGVCKKLGIFFVLVTGYRNQNWVWEQGESFQPDYVMEKVTRKDMEMFLKLECWSNGVME